MLYVVIYRMGAAEGGGGCAGRCGATGWREAVILLLCRSFQSEMCLPLALRHPLVAGHPMPC